MKIKFFLFILIFSMVNVNAFSKPRCELLYDNIYNETKKIDVNLRTITNEKNIGIRLDKYFENVNIDEPWIPKYLGFWKLKTNKDDYFSVGKVTSGYLAPLIFPGDIILSINDLDLREMYKDKEKKKILKRNVSEFFDEDEEIIFKLLRNGKTVEIKYAFENIKTKIINTIESYDYPMIDFYVSAVEIDEKNGTFDVSIDTSFKERIDNRYSLTKLIWEDLIYNKKYDGEKLISYFYETCTFNEERYGNLNTVDPKYGLKFDNTVQEYKHLKDSTYRLIPLIKENEKTGGYHNDLADIEYKSSSVYKIKNDFNLRTFPFDKQKLTIYLRSHLSNKDIDNYRSNVSSRTYKKALEFKDQNQIQGWNITNVATNYKIYDDPLDLKYYDGFELVFDIERKSGYYIFKIIFPIILILMICWSAVWIDPKEIESRLTVTIVCLLSLIAYNFVIDSELPKLEYLTIMDYMILISYIYAAIPNFLSIYSFQLIKKNKSLAEKYESYEKRYGLPSYILIMFFIIVINTNGSPENTNALFSWMSLK